MRRARRRALHARLGAAVLRDDKRGAMKIVYTDVLVIGGGLAGLRVAIGAKRRGHDAIILSLVPPKRSHSAAAQGGMQASLGNVIKGQGDNEDVHFEDTVRGSDWGADQRVVRMFVDTAPKAVRELAAWGVPWSRVRTGDREVIINGQKVTHHRARRGARPGRAARLRRHQEVAHLLRLRRHRPRDAVRGERPGDRRGDSRARAHGGDRADPRRRPLLRRGRAQPRHRRAQRLRREGHGDRHRRRRASLPRDDQRGDLRRHRHRDRARDRHRDARQHGGDAVPSDRHLPGRHPGHRGLPRRRRPAARTSTAIASCPTTSPRRRSSRRATSSRAAWRSTSARARARSRASATTSGSTSRSSASAHRAQPARGQGDLPVTSSASIRSSR